MISNEQLVRDAQHLNADIWEKVNRKLLAKSIAELMREDVAKPRIIGREADDLTHFQLETDKEHIHYVFSAYPRQLNYWHVVKESVRKIVGEREQAVSDVPCFFMDLQHTFGINAFTLAHYVEELLHTLYADAFIYAEGRLSASAMADADFQTVEHQLDGHPWVIVNKGRIGFGAGDYFSYTPEAKQHTRLIWLAVHRSRASLHLSVSLDEQSFYENELGKEKISLFQKTLEQAGVEVADYHFIPVHEWQWQHKLVMQFAADIAGKHIVLLGTTEDEYGPQQSIRTFFNVSHPHRYYVKTAISILNTSHIRGLSPKQLFIAPRLTDWLEDMLSADPHLQRMGLVLLGEVASISYAHPHYSQIEDSPYQYNEYLGAMWRESPVNSLKPGETLMTMAALLYVDDQGRSLVEELAERSGLGVAQWLKAYLNAYLKPVLQIYYQHAICIDPHGQNVILILENNVPTRIALQDFAGDILINEEGKKRLPQVFIEHMFVASPNPENAPLTILIAVFDAFFRYLSDVLHTSANYPEDAFWLSVYEVVNAYQEEHPELKSQFEKYNLFIPEFKRLIFNSRRLFNGYEETAGFPHMRKSGFLPNPMYQLMMSESTMIKESE